jgi:predicted nucleic acid-binding protein
VSLVLDSSATVAWLFEDETTDAIRDIFGQVILSGAIVPDLWRLEIANTLTCALRRGLIDVMFRSKALADLAVYDITVDGETDQNAWFETLALADQYRLTIYDAAYLELAHRRRLPLATLDRQLAAAARASGIVILGQQ